MFVLGVKVSSQPLYSLCPSSKCAGSTHFHFNLESFSPFFPNPPRATTHKNVIGARLRGFWTKLLRMKLNSHTGRQKSVCNCNKTY